MTKAEHEAESLVFDLGLSLPILPEEVCKQISEPGFHVSYVEEPMQTGDFLGMSKAVDDGALIIVNDAIENRGRKTFTGAHEIGHVVLHIQQNLKTSFSCSREDFSIRTKIDFEKEANEFASALIMPKGLIGDTVRNGELSWSLIDSIRQECGTSLEATARRVIAISNETCALIIHKDGTMWLPIKSKAFKSAGYYIPKRPFSKDLETCPDSPTEDLPNYLQDCDALDWGMSGKDLPDSIFYSSIRNEEHDKTMSLILVPEIEEADETEYEPSF